LNTYDDTFVCHSNPAHVFDPPPANVCLSCWCCKLLLGIPNLTAPL